jgi:hypothetical protein
MARTPSSKHKPAPRRKPSTALARRDPQAELATLRRRAAALKGLVKRAPATPAPPVSENAIGEEATLGALGLVEIKLTPEEEAVLAQPVPIDAVQIKPTGQPYLSHPAYTRWFNKAFGRLGWTIVPRAKPRLAGNTLSCPYILYIHGQPAAFAMGEQEYYESNKEQTYGDAYEATVASALRRCAKRLGVGLELWDRSWLNAFMAEHCVKVFTAPRDAGDKPKVAWRRKTDPKFWNELPPRGGERTEQTPAPRPPSRSPDPQGDEVITQGSKEHPGQVERLWTIFGRTGRDRVQFKMWLVRNYGVDSTKQIKRRDYDAIIAAIEAPGEMPEKRRVEREPGEDD